MDISKQLMELIVLMSRHTYTPVSYWLSLAINELMNWTKAIPKNKS
ncbi:hypothetical protein [Schinkia azotoformans]|nr:hypothetical protein [Schinkia azotoformans]MEC1744117.1 hypothetical protein [Schinkia azotoformans]